MLLLLAAAANAGSYTETFGGTSANDGWGISWSLVGNFYTADSEVTLTGVQIWAKEYESGAVSMNVYLWTEPSSGTTWAPTQIGTVSVDGTSGSMRTATLTTRPTLSAGTTYIIGVYTTDSVYLGVGTAVDPVWGTSGGWEETTETSSSRYWDDPTAWGTETQLYQTLTVEAADADRDGEDTLSDCDDTDATVYDGAPEVWYDGLDNGCDGVIDDGDQDGDGRDAEAVGGEDCDDTDPSVYPGARDDWYDGVDPNCDGASDYDQDRDGDDTPEGGGGDCDDLDPSRSSLLEETWYDGIDTDCDEGSDWDQDRDGYDAGSVGGEDCDDTDPTLTTDCDGGGDTDDPDDTDPDDTDPGGGFGGGGDDDDDDAEDDDDDDEDAGGCLCMASSVAPIGWGALAGVFALRRRRRADVR